MKPKSVEEVYTKARSENRNFLLEPEAEAICEAYGLPVAKSAIANSKEEALKAASKIGYPVVLKIVSPDVLHKSDVGGVIVGVKDSEELGRAYDKLLENVKTRIPKARIKCVLVQEMASKGVEVIVGGVKDPFFGHAIMFGLGGIFVEVLKDVSFRIVPLEEVDAREMIREIKAYPILEGVRGEPPRDVDSIVDIILKVSKMLDENPEIKELDLNPIIVYEKGRGAKIVDARIVLEE